MFNRRSHCSCSKYRLLFVSGCGDLSATGSFGSYRAGIAAGDLGSYRAGIAAGNHGSYRAGITAGQQRE